MDPKARLQRQEYLQVLRRMTPAQRLAKAMELSELGKQLFLHGLRRRFPEADEREIRQMYLERQIAKSKLEARIAERMRSHAGSA